MRTGTGPCIIGLVVRGHSRGRRLGFPTANIDPSGLPAEAIRPGTWAGWIRWPGQTWRPAVANIGRRPTFEGGRLSVEAHVLDYTGDLYGACVEIELVCRLRDERRFAGANALAAQIAKDIEQTRALLGQRGRAQAKPEGEQ